MQLCEGGGKGTMQVASNVGHSTMPPKIKVVQRLKIFGDVSFFSAKE